MSGPTSTVWTTVTSTSTVDADKFWRENCPSEEYKGEASELHKEREVFCRDLAIKQLSAMGYTFNPSAVPTVIVSTTTNVYASQLWRDNCLEIDDRVEAYDLHKTREAYCSNLASKWPKATIFDADVATATVLATSTATVTADSADSSDSDDDYDDDDDFSSWFHPKQERDVIPRPRGGLPTVTITTTTTVVQPIIIEKFTVSSAVLRPYPTAVPTITWAGEMSLPVQMLYSDYMRQCVDNFNARWPQSYMDLCIKLKAQLDEAVRTNELPTAVIDYGPWGSVVPRSEMVKSVKDIPTMSAEPVITSAA